MYYANMDMANKILTALHEELTDNHFDASIVDCQNDEERIYILVRHNDISEYIVSCRHEEIFISKRQRKWGHREDRFRAILTHPRSIEAILSYLHRNCRFGRDVRNHLEIT